MAKVLKPLAQAGLVDGFRGANGGYRLARDPAAISLVEIVEAMEGPLGMTECSLHERPLRHRTALRRARQLAPHQRRGRRRPARRQRWRKCCSRAAAPVRKASPPASRTPEDPADDRQTAIIETPAEMPIENAQIHARLGRKYDAGFVTDIESDTLPPGPDRETWCASSRPARTSPSG